jgi:hypothetical protein
MPVTHPTFSDLIQKCLVELRLEAGISVQQYSEDVLAAILQRQFNTFFDHYWWPNYYQAYAFTLNGFDGGTTQDKTAYIKRYEDVRYVWWENDPNPLTRLPPMMNPLQANSSWRKYFCPVPGDQLFLVLPITLTGTIYAGARNLPDPFKPNDPVKIDSDLLVTATCYNYLADDEDSQSATKKFAEAAGKREAQLREMMNKGPVPFGPGPASPFNDWMMSP